MPTMKKLAELIATLPNSIQLEGHTDSIPIHNTRFKSNWELSCARAIAVLETFCGTFQLNRQALFSSGPGRHASPSIHNETPEGRARNRRVDVVILNSLKLEHGRRSHAPPVPSAAPSDELSTLPARMQKNSEKP